MSPRSEAVSSLDSLSLLGGFFCMASAEVCACLGMEYRAVIL